jgi:hypothetical protein
MGSFALFFGFFGKEPRNIFRFSDISVKNSLDLEKSCELKKAKTLEILNLGLGYMFG